MTTEREKMLAGELYNASDPELVALSKRARRLTRLFNATTEEESERRSALLRELFGAVGGAFIEPPFHCDYGGQIRVGVNFFMNFGGVILDGAVVEIGDNVMCGPGVHIYTAYHPLPAAERIKGPELAAPVRIGDNVWLGGGVIILPGVTIGDNTTIGAGSVVTRDIPAHVLAVGNPCRVIRRLDEA
ncbi:MAG: sugar O-acetyltransferase [Chloroflexi bacterium]|nr:sugar O-acetyltransferase [Chloroflexota bacterium]